MQYTYRHNTCHDLLAPFKVDAIYVFDSADAASTFVDRCLDGMAPDYVVIEGEWSEGFFIGSRVVV